MWPKDCNQPLYYPSFLSSVPDVYITDVIASWVLFIVNPRLVSREMGWRVAIVLVQIEIFFGVRTNSPSTSQILITRVIFLVFSLFEVFAAFVEYAISLSGNGYQSKTDIFKTQQHTTTDDVWFGNQCNSDSI